MFDFVLNNYVLNDIHVDEDSTTAHDWRQRHESTNITEL